MPISTLAAVKMLGPRENTRGIQKECCSCSAHIDTADVEILAPYLGHDPTTTNDLVRLGC